MGESIVEGTLTKWLKKPGERIERDEPLFEISTDKVDTEIPSPAAGTLAEILVEEGKTVGINTVVARIEEGGATAAKPAESKPAAEDSDTREKDAARRLQLARQLLEEGKADGARESLEEIVRKYKATKAAEEAQELLRKLGK